MKQDTYVSRTLESVLTKAANEFPAVLVTGPRQSGKTTILKRIFSETHQFVSLDEPDVQSQAAAAGIVFTDHIGHVPDQYHHLFDALTLELR